MDIPDILHENSRYELHEHKKKLFKRHEIPKFRDADIDSENPTKKPKKEKSSYPEKKSKSPETSAETQEKPDQ